MARQNIGIGTTANDGTGDSLRVGGDKINDNFIELYGSSEETGATLLFTKKELIYNAGTPSSAATVTIDGTGAIAPSVAIFVSDGTTVSSIVAAGAETIRTTIGDQPAGVGYLFIMYDGTAYQPTWLSSGGLGDVQSVNSQTPDGAGNVLLDADDIAATATRKWMTVPSSGDGQTGSQPIELNTYSGFTVGTPSAASSAAAFEIDLTGAISGAWAQIFWNGSADPSFSFTGTSATINTYPSGAAAKPNEDNIIIIEYDGTSITKTFNSPVYSSDLKTETREETGTSFTIAATDNGKYIEANNASAITVTIDDFATVAFPVGGMCIIEQKGAGTVTVQGDGSNTVNGELSTIDQYKILVLFHKSTDVWNVVGGTT